MARRIRLGIIYSYSDNWIAGKYYILNLVKSFNVLEDHKKPQIILIVKSRSAFLEFCDETEYPYVSFFRFNVVQKAKFYIFSLFDRVFSMNLLKPRFDVVYPNPSGLISKMSKKKLYWIPDFQERIFPDFFNQQEINNRKSFQENLIKSNAEIVLSSSSSENYFRCFYPDAEIKPHIVPFAVTVDKNKITSADRLKKKFPEMSSKFFVITNQFWQHKNHITAFKAVKKLKAINQEIQLICTGKMSDYRNPEHVLSAEKFVAEHGLEKNILFLGFVSEEDVLGLIDNAVALIQPSLFEGWNTSIEYAKSLNKFVVASDIDVHREQLMEYDASFFDCKDFESLSKILYDIWNRPPVCAERNYKNNISRFAESFLKLLK